MPPECTWLLEIAPDALYSRRLEEQQQWLDAVVAARTAGERATQVSGGTTSSWNAIIKDGQFSHLPSRSAELQPDESATEEVSKQEDESRKRVTPPRVSASGNSAATLQTELDKGAKEAETVSRIRHQKRARVDTNNHAGYSPLSSTTAAADRLGILDRVEPEGLQYRQIRHNLTSAVEADSELDTVVALKGSDSVRRSNLVRLREGVWLDDAIINFVSRQVVRDVMDIGHSYSSYFFSKLLHEGEETQRYDFGEVRRWHTNVDCGLFNLRELYVPINKDNSHWLLLRVALESKTISIWDSLGWDPSNRKYLRHMLRYLYDVHQLLHPEQTTSFSAWSDGWALQDQSNDCPHQGNSYDCGVFTLINMALLAQGADLKRLTYSQDLVYMHRTRHRLAEIILKVGDTRDTIAGWLRPRGPRPTVVRSQGGRQTERTATSSSSSRKVTRTGTGIVKRKRHVDEGERNLPAEGNKRSKKSIADDPLRGIRQYFREFPPRKLPWESDRNEKHKRRRH